MRFSPTTPTRTLRTGFSPSWLFAATLLGAGFILFSAWVAAGGYLVPHSAAANSRAEEDAAERHDLPKGYGKLPLSFASNQGQVDSRVRFEAHGLNYSLFLTRDEAVFAMRSGTSDSIGDRKRPEALAVLRMNLVGATRNAEVEGLNELPGKLNYFIGNDSRKWRSNVPTYSHVEYRKAYAGIDLIYHGNQHQLEYDFQIAPGASPRQIRMSFKGARKMAVDKEGNLIFSTTAGEVRQNRPIAYQEVNGVRRDVAVSYRLAGNKISFETGNYDRTQPLVIDPVFVYSSFLGGTGSDQGLGVAVDGQGSAYLTGVTSSTDFPLQNPFKSTLSPPFDLFIIKLNAAGTALSYGTYLGGTGSDFGNAIAVDAQGSAYVVGNTSSADFPTTAGALQNSKDGFTDGFVAKLSPSGSSLVYSTFLGGEGNDIAYSIAVDTAGRAHLAGKTDSSRFNASPFPNPRGGSPLYKSGDGAANWSASDSGLTASSVNALALDPGNSNTIYAGTNFGVSKSTDAAAHWNRTGGGSAVVPLTTNALALDPSNTSILYAGTNSGIYKSTDGGNVYVTKNSGLVGSIRVASLAIDPNTPTTVYAGFVSGFIYKSTDGGDNWVQIRNGIPSTTSVNEVVIDPTNTAVIYIGTSRGMFKTTNGGALWSAINGGVVGSTTQILALAMNQLSTSTLYAGLSNSPDSLGKTTTGAGPWTSGIFTVAGQPVFFPGVQTLSIDPVTTTTLYAAASRGAIFKSTDAGANWSQSTVGMSNSNAAAVAIDRNNPATVYAGTVIGSDVFAARLNPAGSALEYLANFGGSENDEARGVALDTAGNAYIVGNTSSPNFPTVNPFQPVLGGSADAFVAKVSPAGALLYSTYLGGDGFETGNAIAVRSGNAYVTGQTSSSNFPVVNAIRPPPSITSFDNDAFVTKLSASGTSLDFSTCLGGGGDDSALGLALDSDGAIYVTGWTTSSDFPIAAAPQPSPGSAFDYDAFVTKFNPAGSAIIYSTYLGGNNIDQGLGIAVDALGNAYVTGTTSSFNFPTVGAFQPTLRGSPNAFITKLGLDADLAITKSDSRDPVMVGSNLPYVITVSNLGDTAVAVVVSDTLPAGTTFVSASASQGSCAGTGTVSCSLGNLANGASATVNLVITAQSVGTVTNTAGVTSDTPDHNTANNSSTQQTRISSLPSIAGRVSAAGGGGLSAVNVALTGSQTANTATPANGLYQFPDLSPGGNYTVAPSRQGFVFHPQSRTFSNLTTDATADFDSVACVLQVAPKNKSFPASGGVGIATVTSPDGLCPWTAASDVPWITVTSGSTGMGNGMVTFSVAPTNISRAGTLKIGGNVLTVWQEVSPCATPTFTTGSRVSSGANPVFIAQGDFNNDSKRDVVVLNEVVFNNSPERVSILLGTGNGGFEAPRSITLGGTPKGLAVADFNNDGKLDVAALGGSLKIFLGDGAGNLAPPTTVSLTGVPSFIAVGNFNGDANVDLAVSNETSNNISILLGTGIGTFAPPTQLGNGTLNGLSRVVIGDFNRDSKQDLVASNGAALWLIRGNGDGTFAAPTQLPNNLHLGSVVVGDFNKDNKDDLAGTATASGAPVISVVPGDGTGGFGSPINSSPTAGRIPSSLLVADFNGDGNPDLGSLNNFQSSQDVNAFLGDGNGSFTPGPAYVTGMGPREFTVGDFNGDGKPDLAVADTSLLAAAGDVVLLAANGTGGFVAARSFVAPLLTEIVSEDFNSDGKRDLIAFGSPGIFFLPGTAPGIFGDRVLIANETAYTSDFNRRSVSTRDFNHDGKPDLGVLTYDSSNSQSHVKVFLNNGAGVFAATTDQLLENFNNSVLFADFNGDGNPDLISRISPSRPEIWLGNGAGGFNPPVIISPQIDNLSRLESGDFNGDGKLDLAVASVSSPGCGFPTNAPLRILFGDGAGGFAAPSLVAQFNGTTGLVTTMVAQDLNGDGRSDLAIVNGCSKKLLVLFGNAAGDFSPSAEFPGGSDPQRLVFGDVTGDGKPDLIVCSTTGTGGLNVIVTLTGDGSGGFSAPVPLIPESAAASIVVADFDGNGHNDLAVAAQNSGHIGILLNSCPVTQPASTVQFGAPSFSANEGDFVATITVTRVGDTSAAASVGYATLDGTASGHSDYTTVSGTIKFAAGETSKSFPILLTDDALHEETEALTIFLSNEIGVVLGSPNNVLLNIVDNDVVTGTNPLADSQFFVRQHYHDFLNREPDAGGLQFWVNEIDGCGADATCREIKRINVSAAFFLSIEFQETGYLAYRMYNAAYGETSSPNVQGTVPIIRLQEFLPDSQQIGQGVQVGIGNWQQQLEDNKTAYAVDFVQRTRFITAFPLSMTAEEFVARLDQNTSGVLSVDEKSQLVAMLGATPADAQKRGAVLRKVAEDSDLRQRELNRAFVLMQYYGYLRRNPDDPQDFDFRGWKFWLDKLNQFNGNFVNAEMVKSFLVSSEYRQRFGNP